jgi:hypothetical protein
VNIRGSSKFAFCFAVVAASTEADARDCKPPSPECHLENGRQLLGTDPKKAAEELLASFTLDERTDTLVLYATALQLDKQYALALETWKRVILFRESEVTAAQEKMRTAKGKALTAAKAAGDKAQRQMEFAAEAITKLWSNVGKVKLRFAAGQQYTVTRHGIVVDATKDVFVNAGRDELVFTAPDGSTAKLVVEVGANQSIKLDAPKATKAEPPKPVEPKLVKPEPEPDVTPEPKPEPGYEKLNVQWTEQPRSKSMSRIGLGLAAGGVVALGVAGTFGYLGSKDFDDAKALGCTDDRCPFGPAADLAERSNDRGRLAQITAIGGGALIATGVTMWILGRKTTRREAPNVTFTVSPKSAALAWRF